MKQGWLSGSVHKHLDWIPVVRAKAQDEFRFFRTWVENPLKTGAVSPSGPDLARCMASFLHPEKGAPVVELGPGTGVVTQAILQRGVLPTDLKLVEYSGDFCRLLRGRFAGVEVHQGDAYGLDKALETLSLSPGTLGGIVSSLPLLTRPEIERSALLEAAMEALAPGAAVIQFSYGLTPPVRPKGPAVSMSVSGWVWRNLPPARVYVYRRPLS